MPAATKNGLPCAAVVLLACVRKYFLCSASQTLRCTTSNRHDQPRNEVMVRDESDGWLNEVMVDIGGPTQSPLHDVGETGHEARKLGRGPGSHGVVHETRVAG